MRRLAVAVAALSMFASTSALAAEALLIRHEVLSVPVGSELELRPGFFIGRAWTADPEVAKTGLTHNLRHVKFTARAPGRTIVSTWNLREPNKRIEYEIVVVNEGMNAMFPALLPQAVLSDDAGTMPTEAALPIEPATIDDDDTK